MAVPSPVDDVKIVPSYRTFVLNTLTLINYAYMTNNANMKGTVCLPQYKLCTAGIEPSSVLQLVSALGWGSFYFRFNSLSCKPNGLKPIPIFLSPQLIQRAVQ